MSLQSRVISATINGVEASLVHVEVSIGPGLPGMYIVGMGDLAIQEARERVKSAIRAAGFAMPSEKVVVNLAPGGIRKNGAGFDMPIALGVLAATEQIDPKILEGKLFVGELSLHGWIDYVPGDLAFCICASKNGLDYVSGERSRAPIGNIEQLELTSLSRLHDEHPFDEVPEIRDVDSELHDNVSDFSDIKGHECAKRALQVAVAGRHAILMIGPPGSGKSMLASRIPTIMPSLSQKEALQSAAIHSVAGEEVDSILKGIPPFRNPHHTSTTAGLLGGGNPLRPGEASLAHNGVLFLDELAEFRPATLQGLRQPIEDGRIVLTRASGKSVVPSNFMLVAATNPCPCGYYGDDKRECTCTYPMVRRYISRIGGPLIDRFDMQLDVHRVPTSDIFGDARGLDSGKLKEGVAKCLEFSKFREGRGSNRRPLNAREASKDCMFEMFCLDDSARSFAVSVAERLEMSGRSIMSILKVSRTIADMDESDKVSAEHVAEAHAFRMSEIVGGG